MFYIIIYSGTYVVKVFDYVNDKIVFLVNCVLVIMVNVTFGFVGKNFYRNIVVVI